jgi:hypothetical protein
VNCGPRSNFLYIAITVYFYLLIYIYTYYYLLPLDTLNPLFTTNWWDWQLHHKLGQSSWLCCVQVPHCCWCKAKLWTRRIINCLELSWSYQASPSEVWLSPTGLINLDFTTEGRLAAMLIIPSSWGSQRGVIYMPSAASRDDRRHGKVGKAAADGGKGFAPSIAQRRRCEGVTGQVPFWSL